MIKFLKDVYGIDYVDSINKKLAGNSEKVKISSYADFYFSYIEREYNSDLMQCYPSIDYDELCYGKLLDFTNGLENLNCYYKAFSSDLLLKFIQADLNKKCKNEWTYCIEGPKPYNPYTNEEITGYLDIFFDHFYTKGYIKFSDGSNYFLLTNINGTFELLNNDHLSDKENKKLQDYFNEIAVVKFGKVILNKNAEKIIDFSLEFFEPIAKNMELAKMFFVDNIWLDSDEQHEAICEYRGYFKNLKCYDSTKKAEIFVNRLNTINKKLAVIKEYKSKLEEIKDSAEKFDE